MVITRGYHGDYIDLDAIISDNNNITASQYKPQIGHVLRRGWGI